MSWRNVRLICAREIRDQLRDRRTLFMIAVLPLVLYPLLGMTLLQLAQFLHKNESRVLIVGAEHFAADPDLPPLVKDGQLFDELFEDPADAARFNLELEDSGSPDDAAENLRQARLMSGDVQVVVRFPADFDERLKELREALKRSVDDPGQSEHVEVPEPEVIYNSAREKSALAGRAIERVLGNWKAQVVRQNLLAGRVPVNVAKPFQIKPVDVAEPRQQDAVVWAKLLPFVLFIWALTGAFYPAVDLCAGEKERGTLETLLSSPAGRNEIVWGKLLTVMTFSMATALLNLSSLGFTAQYTLLQLKPILSPETTSTFSLPSLPIIGCMFAALVPMSALFSALCLACAAFARSTKEGQYYLMPLLMVTMPLMFLPMSPGIELNLGNSLIPVTGVVLLLRTLVSGNYADALPYILPVVGVTLVCCLLAIRWAVYQFNQESVLFRESERLDMRRWIVHLVRDRRATPSLAEAFFCAAMIFVIQFFIRLSISANIPKEADFSYLSLVVVVSQVVCILLPALMMTLFLTERPRRTLLLERWPSLTVCVAAVALALVAHPLGQQLTIWIQHVYPLQDGIRAEAAGMGRVLEMAPYVWLPFLLMAVLPAVCEEIAFRGFILSGLRHVGHKWWAIGFAAVFFGFAHTVVQQSIAATTLGLLIGYIAVQTDSLIPGMLFHATYNSLLMGIALGPQRIEQWAERWPMLKSLYVELEPGHLVYRGPVVIIAACLSLFILLWFRRLPHRATKEERLSDVRALQTHPIVGPAFHSEAADPSA